MAKKNLMYGIDSAVGKYCANKPDDVYLIRFFLRKINKAPNWPV
jgi:hypothetical protein